MTNIQKIRFGILPIQSTTHRRALLVFAGVLTFASVATAFLSNTSPVLANVKCKPDVKVTNNKGASIKVLNFKYKIGSGTVYTEGLANKVVGKNDSNTWNTQSLNHAATGIVITETAIEYKDDTGRGYGPSKTSSWTSHTSACNSAKDYNHVIQ